MNEEGAPRKGSSRHSGGSRQEPGGGGATHHRQGPVPRQAQEGRGSHAQEHQGADHDAADAAAFGAAELTAALQQAVSGLGASGPPRAGIARIRKRAKARQQRRTVMAGGAGVLVVAMAVSAATGNGFNIVPALTSMVGLGGNSSRNTAPSAQGPGTPGQVRTVLPGADAAGKKGPAIGPQVSLPRTPTALAATGVPQCTAQDLTMSTSVDAVIGGVSYGHVDAVAQTACAVAGPPLLQVENATGDAASSVVILEHQASDGSQLPNVSTWGAVLKLAVGGSFEFQFAWAPDQCTGTGMAGGGGQGPPGGSQSAGGASQDPSAPATGPAGPVAGDAGGQDASSAYSLSYLAAGLVPTPPVNLTAACGATVYVTDLYAENAYPLPQPTVTPTPQPTDSATTPSTQPTPPPTSTPPDTSTPSAVPSGSPSATDGAPGDDSAGASPPIQMATGQPSTS